MQWAREFLHATACRLASNRPGGEHVAVNGPRVRTAGAAFGSGLLIAASVPPWGWWPLAFLGVAGMSRLIAGRSRRGRMRVAVFVALGWFMPSVVWMLDFTPPGYFVTLALFGSMLVGALAVTPSGRGRWIDLPGALVLMELVRWSWPFGGVPLSTLAMSQADAPLAPVVRFLGPLLLVALVALLGVAIDAAAARSWTWAGALGVVFLVVAVVAPLTPRGTAVASVDVALVQGGGPQRTRAADTDEREVFDRHVEATGLVEQPVDLVLWPENVINVEGPVVTNPEGDELSALARSLDAPMVVGAVEGERDGFRNAALLIEPDGSFTERFEKVRRVPFGEFVPFRSLLEPFAGNALPARDAIEGEGPAVLDTPVGPVGVVISWEVFFAPRARDAIGNGGEILLNPTNGSSYWLTIVQSQQVASSQLRALETGRWVLQAAPTGFSAVVDPDGEVLQRTGVSEQKVLRAMVDRRTGQTIATRVGDWPMLLMAIALLAGGWWWQRREKRPAAISGARSDGSGPADG
jgi:apolipoprotein N-acyltransferase